MSNQSIKKVVATIRHLKDLLRDHYILFILSRSVPSHVNHSC